MSFRTCFAIAALPFLGSCNRPPAADGRPVPVSAADLAAAYRSDPGTAGLAYTNRLVSVRLTAFDAVGSEIHWRPAYLDPLPPPAVVFRFDAPPKLTAPCWVEGTCRGGDPVVVTGCRAASP